MTEKNESKEVLNIDNSLFEEEEDTLKDRYLTFHTGKQTYAVEIRYVTEIIGIQKITKVPNIKKYIKGIINLRGSIVPIIDIRTRFNMPEIDYNERTCIIVVNINDTEVGLIVDEVSEVINIPEDIQSSPPETNKGTESRFISGVSKISETIVIILDIYRLLYDEKHKQEVLANNNG